jgi:hypothetical protein
MVIQLPMLHPKGRVPLTRQPRTDARPPAASGAATRLGNSRQAQPGCFQAIPRYRNAPAGTGQHHRRHRQSNRLAAALSSRVLCRRGAQEARPHARVRRPVVPKNRIRTDSRDEAESAHQSEIIITPDPGPFRSITVDTTLGTAPPQTLSARKYRNLCTGSRWRAPRPITGRRAEAARRDAERPHLNSPG